MNWMAAPLSVRVKPWASSVPNGPSAWVGFGAGGGAVLHVDRGAGGHQRRAVIAIQRHLTRQVELLAVLQINTELGLHHQPGAVGQRHVALRGGQVDPIRAVLLGGHRGQGVRAALLVDAAVACVGDCRAADRW